MENPIGEDTVMVVEVKDDSLPQSQRRNPRRRLIQSTLFPHKPQVTEINAVDEGAEEDKEDGDDCGSPNGKRKRKTRGRPKKITTPKKAPETGKEAAGRTENKTSPLPAGKRSGRKLKEKFQGDASPCKELTASGSKSCRRRIMTNGSSDAAEDTFSQTEHAATPVFDLRLEAKLAAEENARLSAGKQTHPFFSSRKVAKKSQETVLATEPENKSCLFLQEDYVITCPPVHVFEKTQDDVSIDWRDWKFSDKTLLSSSSAPESASYSVFEGSVEPLSFNDFFTIPYSSETSLLHNDMSLDQSCNQIHMNSTSTMTFSTTADLQVQERNKVDFSVECTGSISNLIVDPGDRVSLERVTPNCIDSDSQPDSSLWTAKYQPEKASEVCGNGDSVKFLNEWLQCWRERDIQTNKNSARGDKFISLDSDYSSEENDSDAESLDGEGLKNVLLVTGPVGSGKSAAIYACAKEQGFEVIEVSASDWRNGAHVKQKFGEAMESHRFSKWSLEESAALRMKNTLDFSSVQIGNSSAQFETDVVELISETCPEEPEVLDLRSKDVVKKENINACSRGASKTLILFEDVDTIFDEDRGFISTILQLAGTAKRPMILTSNSQDPVLPDQLDRLEVCFAVPSPKELLTCLHKVCVAEKAKIPSLLIERLIRCCYGDIRKTIMLLQFWCQGKNIEKERESRSSYYPEQVDLDAWHCILPKVIPWGFPCQLADLVEKEITKSLTTVIEKASSLEVLMEEELSQEKMQDSFEIDFSNETESIVAKKEAMLSRNGFLHDTYGSPIQLGGAAEVSNLSGSPVAFSRRNAKRSLSTVFSSLSGDECTETMPATSHILPQDSNVELLLSDSDEYLAHTIAAQNYLNLSTAQLHHCEMPEQELCRDFEIESHHQMCDTYKSLDVSCVPESSYVPETEINNGAEFPSNSVCCADASVTPGAFSPSGMKSIPVLPIMNAHDLHQVIPDPYKNSENVFGTGNDIGGESVRGDEEVGDAHNLHQVIPDPYKNSEIVLRTGNDIGGESVRGDEEVGDSHTEHEGTDRRGYQVMDECSRADFNMASTSFKDSRCLVEVDPVHETWSKLQNCHEDLKSHITSEQKEASQIVNLVSGLTDLLSEADLMLGCGQPLISDSVESLMVPSLEPDAFSWPDKQLEIRSTVVQHGLCLFMKKSAETGLNLGLKNGVDLAWEMLAFTTNTTELGKLVTQDLTASQISWLGRCLENGPPRSVISLKREAEERLNYTLQGLVPPRLYLALKGSALNDYVSTLGQISKLEASRLSKNIDKPKNRRRARVARHYLSTGQLMLSPEEVLLLAQSSCYGTVSFESTNANRVDPNA